MEGKGAAGNFILKNFSGKGFEFSVFCDPVSGKITGSKAGEKCQDKKQSDENRKFIFPDFKRHKTVFHYCLQTYTMWRVLMVSKQNSNVLSEWRFVLSYWKNYGIYDIM